MLEIFAIIYFTRKIGSIAAQKGLDIRRWKWYVVLTWIGAELTAIRISMELGQTNMMALAVTGIGFALAACLTLQDFLLRKEDKKQKRVDINQHIED